MVAMDFYAGLEAAFNQHQIDAILTSGQACIRYHLYRYSKDSDWVVKEAGAGALLTLLTSTAGPSGTLPQYTKKFGAPLDERWLCGGWSSHLFYPEPDGSPPSVRVDLFARPPRVANARRDAVTGVMAKGPLACMKKTQREKDWPYVHELGRLMLGEGDMEALLHIQDATELSLAIAELGEPEAAILEKRPLLMKVGKISPADLDNLISVERRFWQTADKIRLRLYAEAWAKYGSALESLSPTVFTKPLPDQHNHLVELASSLLPFTPLFSHGGDEGIYNATIESLKPYERFTDAYPGPPPVNRFS